VARRPTSGPKPWSQFEARTTFLRVPSIDWPSVKRGWKTEFRATGRAATQVWNIVCPTPVVAYKVTNERIDHDAVLLVLEATWREPLGAISEESIQREGFESMAHFRRYWMGRTKRRFSPLTECQVYRVRPMTPEDVAPMGIALLHKLYGEFLDADS
jgi:hypothetical protein